jgi:ABC-type Fe3+/spermidine/putrescine transport system ATPase subunit
MLELRHIHKQFGPRVLVRDLSLRIAAGEIVALLGPSGCGKSTLLKIVAGLEPADRGFALMFQDFALFPHLNVLDNVAFGLVEQRLPRAQARQHASAMLGRFGLATQAQQQVWTLSGGEQQRVALARALITAPLALLLDEPFSALDAELRQSLRDEFRQHIAAAGMATLLVTHDEQEAMAMATRAVRLQDGQLQPLW